MSILFKLVVGVTWMYEILWPIVKLALLAMFLVASTLAMILVFMKMWGQLWYGS